MNNTVSIDEYHARIMRIATDSIPKETKAFLKTETQKLKRRLLSRAKEVVPRSEVKSEEHRRYHDSFKAGKTYKYNQSMAKRVFNRSSHGRYVEYGRTVARGYKLGESYKSAQKVGISKHYDVYKTVIPAFADTFDADCDAWIDKMMKEGKL